MAFPVIQATTEGVQTSNSTSWSMTYPTGITAGELLLILAAADGNPNASLSGWLWALKVPGGGTACSLNGLVKVADGTETGSLSVTMSASEQGGWRIFRISNWEGGLPAVDFGSGTGFDCIDSGASGTSTTPDPPSLDPANWATEDTLWIATCGVDTSRTISVYPLADNQNAQVSGGAGGATLGTCTLNDAVSSKDPGTFTISASDDWAATTIAVRPAAAAGPAASLIYPPRPMIRNR
jgi:trimeric autotransporter adhesin